jgi:molybdenum cofactor biosynthesis enzyme MoaA
VSLTICAISLTDRQFPVRLLHAGRGPAWLPKREILTYEEILRLARVFIDLGIRRSG